MVTLDDCIEYCREAAERYRTAPERIPGVHPDELLAGWKRYQEIHELLEKAAIIAKNFTGGSV